MFMLRTIRVGLVALAVSLAASGGAMAETIRLGAILPLTGPGAVIGTQQQRGIQFAVEEINARGGVLGNKIEVLFEDNQAKPDQSVLSFNKLVDLQHVPMIFTAYSGPSLAMAPLATRKKILMVNAGAQADQLATASPYLFNTIPTIGGEIEVLSRYLTAEGKKVGAILFENDAAGISGRDNYRKFFPADGGKIIDQEPTQFGQTDFRPALLKVADAKPDVMLVAITAGLLQMAQQYKQLDGHYTVAGTTFFADPPTIADPSSAGFIHTQVRIEAPPEMAAAFKKKFGADMEFFVKQYYNATMMMATVLEKVLKDKKPLTGENLRQAIFDIRTFKGLIPMEFKTNTASIALDINVMRDGKDNTLKEMKSQ
jgi:branched-chain amino acid transport system substrate-binding protein